MPARAKDRRHRRGAARANDTGARRKPRWCATEAVELLPIDGEAALFKRHAITEHRDAVHPAPPLRCADAFGRTRVRGAAQIVAREILASNNLRAQNCLKHPMG